MNKKDVNRGDDVGLPRLAEEVEATALFKERMKMVPKAIKKDAKAVVSKAKQELKRGREDVTNDLDLKKRKVELANAIEEIESGTGDALASIVNVIHATETSKEVRKQQRRLRALKKKQETTRQQIELANKKAMAEIRIFEEGLEKAKADVMDELRKKTKEIDEFKEDTPFIFSDIYRGFPPNKTPWRMNELLRNEAQRLKKDRARLKLEMREDKTQRVIKQYNKMISEQTKYI